MVEADTRMLPTEQERRGKEWQRKKMKVKNRRMTKEREREEAEGKKKKISTTRRLVGVIVPLDNRKTKDDQ